MDETIAVRRSTKRALIVRHAREEFAAHGFDGAQLAVIAARAGIKRPTFFHYFTEKEELYRCATDVFEELAGELMMLCTSSDAVANAVACLHRHLSREPALGRLLLRAVLDSARHSRGHGALVVGALAALLATEHGRASDTGHATDTEHAAHALLGLVCFTDVARRPPTAAELTTRGRALVASFAAHGSDGLAHSAGSERAAG